MIKRLSHAGVWVLDQDEALAFYTEKLGFEVRTDARMDNGFRWLTVGPKDDPDFELILGHPGPPMIDEESAAMVKGLVAKGVTFLQEPAERPYGIEAVFRDNSGNWFSLTEHR